MTLNILIITCGGSRYKQVQICCVNLQYLDLCLKAYSRPSNPLLIQTQCKPLIVGWRRRAKLTLSAVRAGIVSGVRSPHSCVHRQLKDAWGCTDARGIAEARGGVLPSASPAGDVMGWAAGLARPSGDQSRGSLAAHSADRPPLCDRNKILFSVTSIRPVRWLTIS